MVASDLAVKLKHVARELRPPGRPYVSVVKIAREYGAEVLVRLHRTGGRRDAEIDFMSRPPRILVFRPGSVDGERILSEADERLLTVRERFSIAHELGHWIAYQKFRVKPGQELRQYWGQEECVNAFASGLLAPDWLINTWLEEIPEGELIPPTTLRHWAASECRISEEVVATTLCEKRHGIGFMKLIAAKRKRDDASILKVLFSTCGMGLCLPKNHSHIVDARLRELLGSARSGARVLRELRLARCEPQDLKVGWRHVGSPALGGVGIEPNANSVYWISLTVDNFVAAQRLLFQQGSTNLNT